MGNRESPLFGVLHNRIVAMLKVRMGSGRETESGHMLFKPGKHWFCLEHIETNALESLLDGFSSGNCEQISSAQRRGRA